MYCKAITIRLLVGRLTPAMRAKSATPCSGQTVADPEGPGRYLSVRMSPEKGHKRKKPTAAMPFAARHRCSSPTGYFRLINGFQAVSSTSTRYFPRLADRNPLADPAAMLVSLFRILFLHRTRISSRIDLLTFFLSRRDRRDPTCGRCREGLVYGLCDFGDRCHAIDRTQHSLLPVMRD